MDAERNENVLYLANTPYSKGPPVTDESLEQYAGCTFLQVVDLSHNRITDAGIGHLAGLTALETLILSHTAITDAGLKHLLGLTALRHLYLHHTDVTPEGVAGLQNHLPHCQIHV